MNSNLFQTILTVLTTVSGLATSLLLGLGCHEVAGAVTCVGSTAPAWLLPYLAGATGILGVVKLIISAFNGKLTAPTVVKMTLLELGVTVVALVGLGAGVFVATRSPAFIAGFTSLLISAILPAIFKGLKPKDFTQEQKDRIAMGEDPFHISKLDHEHWLQRQAMKKKRVDNG